MRNRNEGLDLLRLICAFLVICNHAIFPRPLGSYIGVLGRISIPIFFMITGYFSLVRTSQGDALSAERASDDWSVRGGGKELLKILKLILFSSALYFAIGICDHLADGTVIKYVHKVISSKALLNMLVFNKPIAGFHLWYLFALLYATIFITLMDKVKLRKLLYILTPFLIVSDLVLGRYSFFFFGRTFPVVYTRNWLFFGVPNICLGMMLKEYDIVERTRKYRSTIACITPFLIFGIFLEYKLLLGTLAKGVRENYIFLVLSSVPVFILFAQMPRLQCDFHRHIADMGRELSAGIYIVHLFFLQHLEPLVKQLGVIRLYRQIRPIIIFILSAAVIWLYNAIKKRIIAAHKPSGSIS